MELTLIFGPMKSGKSAQLIEIFSALDEEHKSFALFQPIANVRDDGIWSRNGRTMDAKKVSSLKEAVGAGYSIIGIDEIHMFPSEEARVIEKIVSQGTQVIAAGLKVDYRGKIFDINKKLLGQYPAEVRELTTTCEKCAKDNAYYSQVLLKGVPLTSGLPPFIPDDGTYQYMPVCEKCFVRK